MDKQFIVVDIWALEDHLKDKYRYIGGRFPPTSDLNALDRILELFKLLKQFEIKE